MSSTPTINDAKAYRQACVIADRQIQKLSEVCPEALGTEFLQSGRTMFMWGVFAEMTGDDQRSFKLLARYLREHAKVDSELSECQAGLIAAASKWNDMVKEVSNRGRQAYRENDDDQLGRVVLFLLEHMGLDEDMSRQQVTEIYQ
jgi:hypothetical protein